MKYYWLLFLFSLGYLFTQELDITIDKGITFFINRPCWIEGDSLYFNAPNYKLISKNLLELPKMNPEIDRDGLIKGPEAIYSLHVNDIQYLGIHNKQSVNIARVIGTLFGCVVGVGISPKKIEPMWVGIFAFFGYLAGEFIGYKKFEEQRIIFDLTTMTKQEKIDFLNEKIK